MRSCCLLILIQPVQIFYQSLRYTELDLVSTKLQNRFIQIFPFQILFFNQFYFPFSLPLF